MVKAIKVMLIPNNVQKTKLFQYAGASRFAYNWALAREIENYEKGGKFISDAELRKEFTKLRHSDEYAWLLNISLISLERSRPLYEVGKEGLAALSGQDGEMTEALRRIQLLHADFREFLETAADRKSTRLNSSH